LINVICYRWKRLLNAVDVHPSPKRLISSYSGGIFFNMFLPSTIGGDFVRSIDLAQRTQKAHEVVATVIMDRLSGYTGMMIVGLTGILCGIRIIGDNKLMLMIGGLTVGLAVILVLLFNDGIYTRMNAILGASGAGRIRKALQGIHEQVYFFRSAKKIMLENLFLSVLIQLIAPIVVYVILIAMGLHVSLAYLLVVLPVISAIAVIPISTGGLGLRDALNVFFLAKVGIARNAAFAMSLINFAFLFVIALAGGLIYVLTLRSRRV
jgi:glycosyltransferase 2 family protein